MTGVFPTSDTIDRHRVLRHTGDVPGMHYQALIGLPFTVY